MNLLGHNNLLSNRPVKGPPAFKGSGAADANLRRAYPTYPSPISAKDIIIIDAFTFDEYGGYIDTPMGYTLLSSITTGSYKHYVYWKAATGTETGTVEIHNPFGNQVYGVIHAFSGFSQVTSPFAGLYASSVTSSNTRTLSFNSNSSKTLAVALLTSYGTISGFSLSTPNGFTVNKIGTSPWYPFNFLLCTAAAATTPPSPVASWTTSVNNSFFTFYLKSE